MPGNTDRLVFIGAKCDPCRGESWALLWGDKVNAMCGEAVEYESGGNIN